MTTKELELCPFCGGEVEWVSGAIKCRSCSVSMDGWRGFEQTNERWNRRYKRTCHFIYEKDEYPVHFGKWKCTSCGKWWMHPPFDLDNINFCPNCGAEVVNDN